MGDCLGEDLSEGRFVRLPLFCIYTIAGRRCVAREQDIVVSSGRKAELLCRYFYGVPAITHNIPVTSEIDNDHKAE